MKSMALIALLALITVPGMAMSEKQSAYIAGIEAGYNLGSLHTQGLGNATAAKLYNEEIRKYNDAIQSGLTPEEFAVEMLAEMPLPSTAWYPKVLKEESSDPWAGSRIESKERLSSETKQVSANSSYDLTEAQMKSVPLGEEGYLGGV